MREPTTTVNGDSYERAAIEEWVRAHGTDPQTRQPLALADLRVNRGLRDAIEAEAEPLLQAAPPPRAATF